MFGLLFVVFAVVFVLSVIIIGIGAVRTFRLSSKVHQVIDAQMDEALEDANRPKSVTCSHCSATVMTTSPECPFCGATL